MRVFAIGDMHLESGTGKTMDRFGDHWRNHDQKIFESWDRIGRDDDVLIIAGDTSWAMRFDEARGDLDRIGRMKGLKVMVKGNHDYWWQSPAKMSRALDPSIKILQADSLVVGRVAIAGTRGWLCPNDSFFKPEDEKIYAREVSRLRSALKSLESKRDQFDLVVVVLHYPPTNDKHDRSGFLDLIEDYKATACVYGHLHGEAIELALTGSRGGTTYYLVSADAVRFAPMEIEL